MDNGLLHICVRGGLMKAKLIFTNLSHMNLIISIISLVVTGVNCICGNGLRNTL